MTVAVAVEAGVATVTVDNPPVNALDDLTLTGLREAAEELAGRGDVRAVVLAGVGERAFLAGADLEQLLHALGPDGEAGEIERHVELTAPVFAAWSGLAQPVVAAVTADAVGGGLELALCCDLIVADPRAHLGLPEVRLGLMPGGGGTQRLQRRIGVTAALELVLQGRLADSSHALELGLVNFVSEEGSALAEATELARELAELPAVALQAAKQALYVGINADLAAGLAVERGLFVEVSRSHDAREGAEAFLQRRTPRFRHA